MFTAVNTLASALLTPAAQEVYHYMLKNPDGISVQEAFLNLRGMSGGALTRRIVDIEEAGFTIVRERKTNPVTGRKYTRYKLANRKAHLKVA